MFRTSVMIRLRPPRSPSQCYISSARSCSGCRPRRLQTAERELGVEIPQARESAEPLGFKRFPRGINRFAPSR
jgi:hypothetical protein